MVTGGKKDDEIINHNCLCDPKCNDRPIITNIIYYCSTNKLLQYYTAFTFASLPVELLVIICVWVSAEISGTSLVVQQMATSGHQTEKRPTIGSVFDNFDKF